MKTMNKFKEGVDYVFIIPEDDGISVDISLISGEFAGVVYSYGKVSFDEDKENGEGYLVFDYELVDSNGFESLETNESFKNFIGDILIGIVSKNLEENKSDSEVYVE